MTDKTLIVVEGEEDENFLKSYIKSLGYSDESFALLNTKGRDNLQGGIRIEIERALKRRSKILIIFDADSDYESTKTDIVNKLKGLEGFKLFLFPDDGSSGTVENLLEKIISPEHRKIFECFEEYKRCISKCMSEYELPSMKAKIYAYKQVLGIFEAPFDTHYWDFENTALEPLKSFLKQNL